MTYDIRYQVPLKCFVLDYAKTLKNGQNVHARSHPVLRAQRLVSSPDPTLSRGGARGLDTRLRSGLACMLSAGNMLGTRPSVLTDFVIKPTMSQ